MVDYWRIVVAENYDFRYPNHDFEGVKFGVIRIADYAKNGVS
jgi:hypothetical protein